MYGSTGNSGNTPIMTASFVIDFVQSAFAMDDHVIGAFVLHDYPDEKEPKSTPGRPEHHATRDAAHSHILTVVIDSLVYGTLGVGDAQECFRELFWLVLGEKRRGADRDRRVGVRILLVHGTQKKPRGVGRGAISGAEKIAARRGARRCANTFGVSST